MVHLFVFVFTNCVSQPFATSVTELYISGSDVDEAVKQLLSPKPEILEAAKPAVKRIKELFTLTKVVPKEGARNAAADIFKQ